MFIQSMHNVILYGIPLVFILGMLWAGIKGDGK